MLLIGLDPGTDTGLAQWSVAGQVLGVVTSMPIHRAMATVPALPQAQHPGQLLVIFEDARKRTWFGKKGREALQGAGSVKRDCSIWEDFLTDHGIPFIARKPQAGTTKWDAAYFQRVTGWTGRTNNHARDAAALVYGVSPPHAEQLLALAGHGARAAA